jgi:hypothetical protein
MSQFKPVIVMVPGGFCDPIIYDKVANIMREDGFLVLVPRLTVTKNFHSKDPTSQELEDLAHKGLPDDVKQIHAELLPLLDQGHEAFLTGHSYGSLPALMAIQGHTIQERSARGLCGGIKGYAVVAGFAYAMRGRNVMGDTEDARPMPYFEHQVSNDIKNFRSRASLTP